jgi:hypothetical protein
MRRIVSCQADGAFPLVPSAPVQSPRAQEL